MTQSPLELGEKSMDPTKDTPLAKAKPQSALTNSLLRDYRAHLDPLNTSDALNMEHDEIKQLKSSISNTSTKVNGSPQEASTGTASSPRPIYPSKQYPSSRPTTGGIAPHRSLLRALASRSSNENLPRQSSTTHTSLKEFSSARTPFAARLAHSPCFFHQRFDDAINIDRVLEEIAAEEDGMSHSRLLQTATSVREISKQLQRRPIKRAVRNIMIVTKARDNRLVYLTRELAEWLLSTPRYNSDLGVNVYVDAKLAKSKRFNAEGLVASNPRYEQMLRYWTTDLCWTSPEIFDLVLTLGGDGTVLYTSWLFQRIVPPILSFSLGSLGFLTNFSFPAYKPALDRIMGGAGMRVNMRMRFTCTVYRSTRSHRSRASSLTSTASSHPSKTLSNSTIAIDPQTGPHLTPKAADLFFDGQYEVLNELVLDRGPSPYVSNLELYGDNQLLTIIQADGVIISTPTGSTAYSLSAGGPLTHPSIPGILLTPICPHTLSFRPMVLSDTLMLRLVVPKNSRSTAFASFDGKGRVELRRGDEVRVEAGRYPFPTVVREGDEPGGAGEEWFESVRRALRWNNRGVVQGGFSGPGGRLAESDADAEELPPTAIEVGKSSLAQSRTANRDAENNGSLEYEQNGYDEDEEEQEEEEDWDIDADPIDSLDGMANAMESSTISTPLTANNSMLTMMSPHANQSASRVVSRSTSRNGERTSGSLDADKTMGSATTDTSRRGSGNIYGLD